jgi:hypothetical protein
VKIVIMIMVVIMVMVVVVVVVVITMIAIMATVLVIMTVTRHILAVVPIVPNKIHGSPARMIFRAMSRPMLLMARRHVQVDRLVSEGGIPVNHHRPRIDQRRRLRHISNIDLPKESGLAHVDGHPDICRHDWCSSE